MSSVILRLADFYDRNGVAIELGMRVEARSWAMGRPASPTYGEVCHIDEDSALPIGIVSDIDSWSPSDVRWFSPDDIECLC